MRAVVLAGALALGLFSGAEARPKQTHQAHPDCNVTMPCEGVVTSARGQRVILAQRGFGSPVATYRPSTAALNVSSHSGIGPRPGRWCGWFMQHDTGVTSRGTGLNLNRAIEWRRVGAATAPSVGAIVVWAHHVGKIVGGSPGAWVVRSGNDGGGVRERVRSVAGAVAFRSI
jgi:hypothetical protein